MNSIDIVFEWLLTASLRASALTVVILGIQLVLRCWLPAEWRHALWLPMLAVLVLPVLPESPFAVFPPQTDQAAPLAEYVVVSDQLAATTSPATAMQSPAAAPPLTKKVSVLSIVWLAGACGVLVAGMIGYRRNMRRIRMNAASPDRMLLAAIDQAACEAGLKCAPQALHSPFVASPAVTGFARPVLLLPAGFPEGFNAAETRLILLHEFSHVKRLDLPLNWLTCALQALHWFNPLLWFAFARMRADREAACDARVLSIDATDRRAEYGGALLKLQCVTPSRTLSLGFVGIFEGGSEIKSRIREISAHRQGHGAWRIAGSTILTLLMVFGVTKGQQTKPPAVEEKASLQVNEPARKAIQDKLSSIIIPRIELVDTPVDDVLEFLRFSAIKNDPDKKGVNLINLSPDATADLKIKSLSVRNIPLGMALKYVCDQTMLRYTVDDAAVTIAANNGAGENPAVRTDKAAEKIIREKLQSIIIPKIDLRDTPLDDAIAFLRVKAIELDVTEADPAKKGVNIVLLNPDATGGLKILEFSAKEMPLSAVIAYICKQTKLRYSVDGTAVIIAPVTEAGEGPVAQENPAKQGD